jgi:hypothetical protein
MNFKRSLTAGVNSLSLIKYPDCRGNLPGTKFILLGNS